MKKTALALLMTTILTQPIMAQNMIDGSNVDDVLNIAKGYGAATLELNDEGKPAIRGRIEGNAYYLAFQNCSSATACEDFFLQAYFINPVVDYELINKWNYNERWTKVYYDGDLDAVLEMDFNMNGGVSVKNFDQAFSIWSQMLEEFFDDFLTKKKN